MQAYCRVFRRRQSHSLLWRMLTVLARSGIMVPDVLSRCAITGTTGYIGSYLSRYLQDRGMQVIELRRTAPGEALSGNVVSFTLGQTISPSVFNGVDTLIHCAYDFTINRWEDIKRINVDGSLQLFEVAAAAG